MNKKDKKAKVPDAGQKKGKKKAEPSDDLEAEFHDDFEASLSQFHPDKTVSDAAPSEPVNASKETPKKKKDPKDLTKEPNKKETTSKKKQNDDQRLKLYNENLERQMVI